MKLRNLLPVVWDASRIHTNQNKIFFLHIPKCGGISLRNAVAATYGVKSLIVPNAVNFLDAASAGYAAVNTGMDVYDFRDVLLAYFLAIPRARFISGHFPLYGAGVGPLAKGWDAITMLREPISKWTSSYYYNRYFENPADVWRASGASYTKRIEVGIEEFVGTEHSQEFGSDYVRQVVRCPNLSDAYRDDFIKEAIERLEAIRLVGILENLQAFIDRFVQIYGVRLKIPHANKNPAKSDSKKPMSQGLQKRIAELCEPNVRIYEHFTRDV